MGSLNRTKLICTECGKGKYSIRQVYSIYTDLISVHIICDTCKYGTVTYYPPWDIDGLTSKELVLKILTKAIEKPTIFSHIYTGK